MGSFAKIMDNKNKITTFRSIELSDDAVRDHLDSKIKAKSLSSINCKGPDCFCNEIMAAYRHAPPELKDLIFRKLAGCE